MIDKKKGLRVISSCRDVYRNGHDMARMGDALSMATVILVVLIVLMVLAAASGSGVSAFITGICVGALAGIVFWSYDQYGRSRSITSGSSR